MLSKLDILVSHPKWNENIGSARVYAGMVDLIMEILGTGDKRTIAFWIGKKRQVKVKGKDILVGSERKGTLRWKPTYTLTYEWTNGFLQRHGYLETIEDPEAKKNLQEGYDLRTFRILKGISK